MSNIVVNKYDKVFDIIDHPNIDNEFFNNCVLYNYFFPIDNKNIIPSLTDYYLSSLYMEAPINTQEKVQNISVANFVFSYFYHKLCEKNKIISQQNTYIVNPFEFLYYYIIGFFPRKEQLELVEKIVKDITPYMPSYTLEPIDTDDNEQKSNSDEINKKTSIHASNLFTTIYKSNINTPKIFNFSAGTVHTALMGSGKTSMITPLSMLRFFQYACLNEEQNMSAIILVMPEVLVNQSYNLLKKSLGTYFPIYVGILNENRITKRNLEGVGEIYCK